MKKLIVILFMLILSINVFASDDTGTFNDQEKVDFEKKEFLFKIGTSYAFVPGKLGLDFALNYYYKLDPYFAFGGEIDFFWIKWDRFIETTELGNASGTATANTDAFTIPVFLNAQVRLPNLVSKIYVEPSITLGLGYTTMILSNTFPETTNTGDSISEENTINFYSGFAWQFLVSADFKPSSNSKIKFVADLGYRSTLPERKNIKIDMSGFIARVGVKFNL